MKTTTRKSVFETNSSSTHSICVALNQELTLPKSIHFGFGEFGWEVGKLKRASSKASYLYTGLINNGRQDDFNRIADIIRSRGIQVTAEEPVFTKHQYTTKEGSVREYVNGENTGYVDHEDELNPFLDAMCNDEGKLMNFLFSDFSFVLTGNDNDDSDVSINVNYPYEEYYKGN